MPGLKKLKKGKKFNYGRNRSRVRKQQEKTSKFNVALKVDCQAMKVSLLMIKKLGRIIFPISGSMGYKGVAQREHDKYGSSI